MRAAVCSSSSWFRRRVEASGLDRPNRVRYEMNSAVIALGLRPGLNAHALVVAGRIRPVDVDHGETSCTTPDAVDYIQRTLARTAARSR